MRLAGFFLLLLLAVLAYPRTVALVDAQEATPVAGPRQENERGNAWRYAEDARFYEVLTREARRYASTDPAEAASRVCEELGGELGFVASPRADQARAGFVCRFVEPDVTMSVDFGELRRTSRP